MASWKGGLIHRLISSSSVSFRGESFPLDEALCASLGREEEGKARATLSKATHPRQTTVELCDFGNSVVFFAKAKEIALGLVLKMWAFLLKGLAIVFF